MGVNRTGIEFIKQFGLLILFFFVVVLWLGRWAERVKRARRNLADTALDEEELNQRFPTASDKNSAHKRTARQIRVIGWSLLAGWLSVTVAYSYLGFSTDKVPQRWFNPLVAPCAMIASIVMVVLLQPWRSFSFWLSFIGSAALGAWFIQAVRPDPWTLKVSSVVGFVLWALLFGVLDGVRARNVRAEGNQDEQASRNGES